MALGEARTGEFTARTLQRMGRLRRLANDLPARALAARVLYLAAHRAGNAQRAEHLRRWLQETVPHCAPLLAPADGPPPDAEWARDPGEPGRAVLPNAWSGPRPAKPGRSVWRRLVMPLVLSAIFVASAEIVLHLLAR